MTAMRGGSSRSGTATTKTPSDGCGNFPEWWLAAQQRPESISGTSLSTHDRSYLPQMNERAILAWDFQPEQTLSEGATRLPRLQINCIVYHNCIIYGHGFRR